MYTTGVLYVYFCWNGVAGAEKLREQAVPMGATEGSEDTAEKRTKVRGQHLELLCGPVSVPDAILETVWH